MHRVIPSKSRGEYVQIFSQFGAGYVALEIVTISAEESHQPGSVTCRVRAMRITWQVKGGSVLSHTVCSSNPSAPSVLHLPALQPSGRGRLLLYSIKSSTPVSDLISFGEGVMAKAGCVCFSGFISDGNSR